MLDKIELFDRDLMLYLNGIHNSFFDEIMHVLTEPWAWIPLYILVIFYTYKIYGVQGVIFLLLSGGLTVLLCDRISVMAFKDVFQRYRPCHNQEIGELIHTVANKCGGKYGFVSSHATNFFGLATLFSGVLRKRYAWVVLPLFLWAAFIGYTRIYLGVHYPADVACGSLLGIVLGIISYRFFFFLKERYI